MPWHTSGTTCLSLHPPSATDACALSIVQRCEAGSGARARATPPRRASSVRTTPRPKARVARDMLPAQKTPHVGMAREPCFAASIAPGLPALKPGSSHFPSLFPIRQRQLRHRWRGHTRHRRHAAASTRRQLSVGKRKPLTTHTQTSRTSTRCKRYCAASFIFFSVNVVAQSRALTSVLTAVPPGALARLPDCTLRHTQNSLATATETRSNPSPISPLRNYCQRANKPEALHSLRHLARI